MAQLSFRKRLLIWLAYQCHTNAATMVELDWLKLDTVRIQHDVWLAEPSAHQYTRGVNLKPPSCTLVCQWVKSAWDAVPIETVKKSFLSCAINMPLDRKEDDKVHCFKPSQPCHGGRDKLQKEIDCFLNYNGETEEDPFASDENE
uniref:DDE-1 domain-containing protein n=1 Tax=Amphimedon queenslandica TaxID=400682 RepID=A0A1X7V213_AMPQE